VAKPNYSYEKRQRDLAKKRKQDEKRKRKLARKSESATPEAGQDAAQDAPPVEGSSE